MAFNIAGRKYLVTGAGRGIGRALCLALSEQGCKVYALCRSKEPLESLAAICSNIQTIQADVGNWDELRAKLKDVEVLDGLINNAAATAEVAGPALNAKKETLDNHINVNLLGSINAIQVIGQKMVDSKRPGSIVNVSSVLSLQAMPLTMGYNMTKAALDMVTKQFALELGPYNIRVNSINPTLVLTEAVKTHIANGLPLDQVFLGKTPMKRVLELNEVVSPMLYLLSDYSSMISGTINIVDGAMMSSLVTEL